MSTKDWIEKDYYKVLGVDKKASAEEIKKAFRKIARDNHPDANPGDKAAEARFKEASEANTILSNPEKRKEYDEARSLFGGAGVRFGRSGSGEGNTGFEDLFRNAGGAQGGFGDLFGNLFGGGSSGSRRSSSRGPRRGADIEGEVKLAFEQAVEGTTVAMRTMSDEACTACRGTGAKPGTLPKVCPGCDGSGMRSSTSGGVFSMSEPCTDCRGRGLLVDDPCPACDGSGRGKSTNTVNVRIPAGVTDGQKIRIKGKGVAGQNGGAAGDLYVTVHVAPHKLFGQQGNNLTIEVPVTFAEASLGADIQIPTLQGPKVKLRVPPNTPNGRTLRVRGKGVRRKDGTMGDLLVTVQVKVPEHLSEAARNALQEYAEKAGQKTRGPRCSEADMGENLPQAFDPEAPVFPVSVAAQLADMHPQTLRGYDRLGLVVPKRSRGRGRRYSLKDVAKLRHIQHLSQNEGINLEGIRRILALEEQIESLTAQTERLSELLRRLGETQEAARIFTADPSGAIHHGRFRARTRLALPYH